MLAKLCLVLLGLAAASAQFPQTDAFHSSLETCVNQATTLLGCIEPVESGLAKTKDLIEDVHKIRTKLETVRNGLNTLKNTLGLAGLIPVLKAPANALKKTIDVIRRQVDQAYSKAKSIDNKLWPKHKDVEKAHNAAELTKSKVELVKEKCTSGRDSLNKAKHCANDMNEGAVKRTVVQGLEAMSRVLNTPFREITNAMKAGVSPCAAIQNFAKAALRFPDLGRIVNPLNSFVNALNPILSFMRELQSVLSKRVCVPNPIDKIAEVGKGIIEFFGKKRRRRGVRSEQMNPIIKRELATMLLLSKRGDICLSVQDVLDGVSGVFDLLLAPVNALIDKLLDHVPSFSLPGLPDFGALLKFNLPSIPSFRLPELTIPYQANLVFLNFKCFTQADTVCQAVSGAISVKCDKPITEYKLTFKLPGFGGGIKLPKPPIPTFPFPGVRFPFRFGRR